MPRASDSGELMKILRKRERMLSENEGLVTLVRAAGEDPELKRTLLFILSLDPFNRKSFLNTRLEEFRLQRAPRELIAAFSSLLDDAMAARALEVLKRAEGPGG